MFVSVVIGLSAAFPSGEEEFDIGAIDAAIVVEFGDGWDVEGGDVGGEAAARVTDKAVVIAEAIARDAADEEGGAGDVGKDAAAS